MDDFKRFFSSTLGIVAAVSIVFLLLCLCCLALAVIGRLGDPTPAAWLLLAK